MLKYYAKLNENEICTEIVSTKKDLILVEEALKNIGEEHLLG